MKDPQEIEVEVKIPLTHGNEAALAAFCEGETAFADSREGVARGLEVRGFIPGNRYEQTDTYFNHAAYDLRKQDKALRIRRETDLATGRVTATINYKGPKIDGRTMSRTEIEFELQSPDEMAKILAGIGYSPVEPAVRKERHDFVRGNVVLSLDRVAGLGDFLEIEVKPSANKGGDVGGQNAGDASSSCESAASTEERLAQLEQVMEELGFRHEDTVRRSYLSMLEELARTPEAETEPEL